MLRRLLALALLPGLLLVGAGAVLWLGLLGQERGPGSVLGPPLPPARLADRDARQRAAARAGGAVEPRQILFGDLHVHTTFSSDAFQWSLPALQGDGAHPPADACDFARYCSALDFWSLNDHAQSLTPRHWRESVQAIRQCNAVADPAAPDVVAFLGWEWTQAGTTPESHYGHKNVILRGREQDAIPRRPIAFVGELTSDYQRQLPPGWRLAAPLLDLPGRQAYFDQVRHFREVGGVPLCAEGVDTRELPDDCTEVARTPRELFDKLDQGGFEALVIPHGTAWGLYTPPGSSWDKQLTAEQDDPRRQFLFEIFSGHGNSEEYRAWRDIEILADGSRRCPEPSPGFTPSCWRAGEIIAERCAAAGLPPAECETRAAQARRDFVDAGLASLMTVPGIRPEDYLDAGQCRDCFLPPFRHRPGNSAQYVLARTNFDDPTHPRRARYGFLASSDNHTARPGTGYKEVARGSMSDFRGPASEAWAERLRVSTGEPEPRSRRMDLGSVDWSSIPWSALWWGGSQAVFERQATFFLTGGLVAVHASGRDRDAIWGALERREVYGTTGERILLWFDLLADPDAAGGAATLPMGSEARRSGPLRFRVRAVGSFEQLPGCPDHSVRALAPDRLASLCRGECYHPSDRRRRIERIEVVRIRPQTRPGEPVEALVEDPWRVLPCPPDPAGCRVEFEDPGFAAEGRDSVYYVRAVQEEQPTVNAGALRCERDEGGRCVRVRPCWGDYRTDPDDDCLAPSEDRAWSSPIFVDHGGSAD